MKNFLAAATAVLTFIACNGCDVKSSKEAETTAPDAGSKNIVAAEIVVANPYGRDPMLEAVGKIPLDGDERTYVVMVLDGQLAFDEYFITELPRRMDDVKFGIVRLAVPVEVLDRALHDKVVNASISKDVEALRAIAGTLQNRVSFKYGIASDFDPMPEE